MAKKPIKIGILISAVTLAALLLGLFLGMMLSYVATTTVQEIKWVTEIDGKTFVHKVGPIIEKKGMPPFAEHLEPYQKIYQCNCVLNSEDQQLPGHVGGGFAYGDKIVRHWQIPMEENIPFSFRSVDRQTLIRQKVENIHGHTTLDWSITISGSLSEDARYYYLSLGYQGGNFAGCDIDKYIDFNPATKILTLRVREKLYRGKYKRYQFEFELQDDKTPTQYSRGEGEIQSIFVPL